MLPPPSQNSCDRRRRLPERRRRPRLRQSEEPERTEFQSPSHSRRRRLPDEKGIETNEDERDHDERDPKGGAASLMRRGLKHCNSQPGGVYDNQAALPPR